MKVAIIGSRQTGAFQINTMLGHIPRNTTELVSGGAVGIDSLAEQAAQILQLPIKVFLPDYESNGHLAPLIRNSKIVKYSDLVLAFWDYQSKGTAHALNCCIENSTPFRIIAIKK